jgi:hypothetical protein
MRLGKAQCEQAKSCLHGPDDSGNSQAGGRVSQQCIQVRGRDGGGNEVQRAP